MQDKADASQADFDIFRNAYAEWKRATEQYNEHITALHEGRAMPGSTLNAVIKDLEHKHQAFITSSKPFVRWS